MPEMHVGRGSRLGPVTVFPLWTGAPAPRGLVTGRAAKVGVAEREGSPVVPELVVTNSGDRPVLLVEGELLEGGWQHRVLQHDLVLAAGGSLVADVACVEAGRWHGARDHVRLSRKASPSLRAAVSSVPRAARQQEVWRRVGRYDAVMGASPTSSYLDHLDRLERSGERAGRDRRGEKQQAWLDGARRLRPLPGQRGVVVGMGGHPVLLELYPSTAALAAHLEQILTGALLDAVAAGLPDEETPSRRVRRLVARLDGLSARPDRDVDAGAGTALAADSEHALVRGVSLDQRWAHLTAFNRRHELLEIG